MGIALGSDFTVNTALALDDRIIAADITARDAIAALRRYEGLQCYVVSEGKNYQLIGGVDNANWEEVKGGGGGAGTLVWQNGVIGPLNKFSQGFEMASFSPDDGASLVTAFIVPADYSPGDQLTLVGGKIIGEGTDNVAFEVEATLLSDGDAITDTFNQRYVTSADIAQSNITLGSLGNLNITDSAGEINGTPVAPGDVIRIELYRVAASVSDSTDNCSIIKNSMFVTTL